jgi:hypothetical protein
MLFSDAAVPGLLDGTITSTFRRWKRAQVKVGGIYRPRAELALLVDAITQVTAGELTDADARAAGEADLVTLRQHHLKGALEDEVLFRIDFHRVDVPDPRRVLAVDADLDLDAIADIDRRLDRLDAASSAGPWTRATLDAIRRHPATVSSVLADELGRDRPDLKLDIRKLKGLGLTESLGTGYRLSPRGEAYVRSSSGGS